MVDYVIKTNNLSKIYFKNKVVNSVNMHVERGKIYGLLGKNGAGKTTTMCMLLNLTYPSEGEIFLFGKNPKKHSNEIYPKIGSIIETPGFYENLTAYENLEIIAKLRGDYNPFNISSVLEMVNLSQAKSKKFKDFSLGMKQRLGIAAAIMHSPELLILDEPINGLDPFGIKEIRALLKRLSHEFGITILISSHILSEIENLADVIGFMDNGVLIEEMSRDELFNRLDKFVEFEVSDIDLAVNIFKELELRENIDFTVNGNIIRLYSHLNMRDKFNAIFVKAGIDVKKVNLCEENLEEFFTRFVSNN
ncbi:ABC transporter ATP-binding protein [uncultured Methanobrevibacter sp.]|jgi:ABC-2 type transport system ATP-binding protein/bacitracin transport system ATP-binding protein|uniref:ABC transporter ATP-binding protein n=1 Tax=Methanobrevibacter sp. TaxID=66852 RepID=UPI001DF711E2|nr:ABC transporter ATP-binding protein [Methanobrevibacter sp.]MBE6490664.1 ABC transporter ATP-binding protein [Methanobrevibacter sp.]MEE1133453.1 ABC transporter ATP-binding protein [Methanobrevibacter sp.]